MAQEPIGAATYEGLPDIVRVLAHDLNNALAAVRILAEMNLDGPMRDDMVDVLEASDLSTALLESMRALMIDEVPPAHDGEHPLLDLARRAADRPALRTLVQIASPPGPTVRLDASAGVRIFHEVLLAARLLSPRGGIQVFAGAEGGEAWCRVAHAHAVVGAEALEGYDDPDRVSALRDRGVAVLPSSLAVARRWLASAGGRMAYHDDAEHGLVLTLRLPVAGVASGA